jgi:hypothetical protein
MATSNRTSRESRIHPQLFARRSLIDQMSLATVNQKSAIALCLFSTTVVSTPLIDLANRMSRSDRRIIAAGPNMQYVGNEPLIRIASVRSTNTAQPQFVQSLNDDVFANLVRQEAGSFRPTYRGCHTSSHKHPIETATGQRLPKNHRSSNE